MDEGACSGYNEKWYFDSSDGFCKTFIYTGCQGTFNRFDSEEECRTSCNAKKPVGECFDNIVSNYIMNV